MVSLEDITDQPLQTMSVRGLIYDGIRFQTPTLGRIIIEGGKIASIETDSSRNDLIIPDNTLIIPGGIDLHVHGRDAHGIFPGQIGSQTHKEDSYTLSLALAQGGATFAMGMFNFAADVETDEQYDAQMRWMNSDLPHRKKPIMQLGGYGIITPGSKPQITRPVIYKFLWGTFGSKTPKSDEEAMDTLANYKDRRIHVHAETIADILDNPSLPHHERRPSHAAIKATHMLIETARRVGFDLHIAHISSPEEIEMVREARSGGQNVTCEITPQATRLDYETFTESTGLPIIWAQQNPPLRNSRDKKNMIRRLRYVDAFATDHAPHTKEEKLKGISGMPQADTAGQVYLQLVTERAISLAQYVQKRSTWPGKLLNEHLGLKKGRLERDYDADLTFVTLNKRSQITDADVMTKCGWTPFAKMEWSNTIEGVAINGVVYTPAVLRKLKQVA